MLSGWYRGNAGIRNCTTNHEGRVLALTQLQPGVGNKERLSGV